MEISEAGWELEKVGRELEKAEGGVDEFLSEFDRKGRCTDRWSFPMVATRERFPLTVQAFRLPKHPAIHSLLLALGKPAKTEPFSLPQS